LKSGTGFERKIFDGLSPASILQRFRKSFYDKNIEFSVSPRNVGRILKAFDANLENKWEILDKLQYQKQSTRVKH
jgi:hypothetical protein